MGKLTNKLRLDDPLDASSVHGAGGVFGCLCTGLFHATQGLFTSGQTELFLAQLLGAAVILMVGSSCFDGYDGI